jgi:hypothetical protein
MPNFNSSYVARLLSLNASAQAEPENLTGKLPLIETLTYRLLGSEVANDTIQLFDLPAGCVIIPNLCSVICNDPGTTLTLDIGDSLDTDRYADDIVLSNGGLVNFASTVPVPAGITTPFCPPATSRVFATVKSAASLTANVVLNFSIVYRIKG